MALPHNWTGKDVEDPERAASWLREIETNALGGSLPSLLTPTGGDDAPQIAAAIAAGGWYILNGQFQFLSAQTVTPGAETRLTWRPGASVSVPAANSAMTVKGTQSSTVALTVDPVAGDYQLTLGDTSTLAAGMWCKLISDTLTGNLGLKKGEWVRINTVDSSTQVTLYGQIKQAYETVSAVAPKLIPVAWAPRVILENPYAIGNSDPTVLSAFMTFDTCMNPIVERGEIWRMNYNSIQLVDCFQPEVGGTQFHECMGAGLGYGLLVSNCTEMGAFDDIMAYECRHPITHGGSTSRYGAPWFCKTRGGGVFNDEVSGGAGWDCHACGVGIDVIDWTVDGSFNAGISHQGNGSIVRPKIRDAQNSTGINVSPGTIYPVNFEIISPDIDRTLGVGLEVQSGRFAGYGTTWEHFLIQGGRVKNSGAQGILLFQTGTQRVKGLEIAGTTVTGSASECIYLQGADYATVLSKQLYNPSGFAAVRLNAAPVSPRIDVTAFGAATASNTVAVKLEGATGGRVDVICDTQNKGAVLDNSCTNVDVRTVKGTNVSGLLADVGTGSGNTYGTTANYQAFVAGGSFTVPQGVTKIRARCVSGGGGGGGGGSAAAAQLNVGGGGGAAGHVVDQELTVVSGEVLTVVVGTGGTSGAGGAAGGNPGSGGGNGTASTLTGATSGSLVATGVGAKGAGGAASSTTTVGGGQYGTSGGANGVSTGLSPLAGWGGSSGNNSGSAFAVVNGGAGGGAATATNGGGGGGAQTTALLAFTTAGSSGASGTSAGVNGTTATQPGCGGGGGGGGAAGTGKGGDGGVGANGLVELWW